jgi:glycosyltransferase involved in cell wall biosynthesis
MLRPLNLPPPDDPAAREVRVFVRTRDEVTRMPHFLAHYRGLGVDRFVVADNGSTDGTTALLAAEPDVHLFAADGSYREARGGQDWLDWLLNQYGARHWCLVLDADELLFYPEIEAMPLRALCDALEREGVEALPCMLLDMYAAHPIGEVEYTPGQSFLAACPWFDAAPYWRTGSDSCPYHEIYGGVRQRVFYPRWQRPGLGLRMTERLYNIGHRLPPIRRNARIQSWRTKRPPNLAKVPLVRWRQGLRYLASTHKISPVRLSAGSGLLLHFKFLGDFRPKAIREARRGEYFDGASEYRRYASVLEAAPGLSLWHPASTRLESSPQLCALGLMTAPPKLPLPTRIRGERAVHA